MEVTLPKEYQDEISQQMKQTLIKAVEEVQQQTAINTPWLKGKRATSKWLGISTQTLDKLIERGLRVHYIDDECSVSFFNKKEITEFILEH